MINIALIQGNVGKIDTKTLSNGTQVTNLSLCTNKKFVKNGEKQDHAVWHNIVLYNKLSEIASTYVKEGDLIFIQGEMENQKFVGKDGTVKYKSFVIGHELKMIPRGKSQDKQSHRTNNSFQDSDIPF